MARANSNSKNNSLKQPKEEINIKYMHRPPRIAPNYGAQNRSILPKSKVSRVLLYDNATQNHMLDIKLAHINIEKERICRIINLHKRSFSTRMSRRHQAMQTLAAENKLPQTVKGTGSSNSQQKDKQLQLHHLKTSDALLSPRTVLVSPRLMATYSNDRPCSLTPNGGTRPFTQNAADNFTTSNAAADDNVGDLKLSNGDHSDKRHVIFRVQDKRGRTEVFHTMDGHGVLSDIIPAHSYSKMTEDPRFKSLQRSLVPFEDPDS